MQELEAAHAIKDRKNDDTSQHGDAPQRQGEPPRDGQGPKDDLPAQPPSCTLADGEPEVDPCKERALLKVDTQMPA